jgi:hypothetical protein
VAGVKLRSRAPDTEVQRTRDTIFEIIAPPFADHRKRNKHSKGAYDDHSFGSAKSTLQGVLDVEAIQRALVQAVGAVPSFDYCYKLIRERLPIDSHAEVQDHNHRITNCL